MGEIRTLNGLWTFTIDPRGRGEEEKWYCGLPAGDRYPVPGVWQTYRKELYSYTGYAWYSREFTLEPELRGKRIFIEFAAVDFRADVWLNGKKLGMHEGGYTPFRFEVTDLVRGGEANLLVVCVFDPEENQELPHGKQGSWYSRVSGIWQDVRLLIYNEAFIEKVKITPDLDQDTVHFTVLCDGVNNLIDPNVEIMIYAAEDRGRMIEKRSFPYRDDHTYSLGLTDPCYWSPSSPWLYHTEIILKDGTIPRDRMVTYFGLRKIHWEAGRLFLNNRPFYLRGALDQGFWPETIYYAPSESLIQEEIKKARDMGFNLLRKHIKTEDPRYLYWADRMGMLIWAEPPNCAKWSELAKARFKKELFALIERDYNHPSIIIWSIYNEEWGLEWRLRNDREKQLWVNELYREVKKADPTRLVCDNSGWAHVCTDLNDYHRYFAVPELAEEWRADLTRIVEHPEENYALPANHWGEPILISEFGMWGLPETDQITGEDLDAVPWWQGSARIFKEEFKIPATAARNFRKYGLDRIFSNLNELARAAQEREFRGVKFIIEEIRKRPEIAGYVVTELTDIEWETNGFLTYNRQLKAGFAKAPYFNGETIISADLNKRNFWCGETLRVRPVVVNNTDQDFQGEIVWNLNGTRLSEKTPLTVLASAVTPGHEVLLPLPNVDTPQRLCLRYELRCGERVICQNEEELTITPPAARVVNGPVVYPVGLPPAFITELVKNGFKLAPDGKAAGLCLTTALTPEVRAHLEAGGHVLWLAESQMTGDGFTLKKLVEGENWDRAAAVNFLDPSLFPGVPVAKVPGWEMAGLYPATLVTNLDTLPGVRMYGGMFQGWLGNLDGFLVELPLESGRIWITTLRLGASYNQQPIGTLMLNQLMLRAGRGWS